MWPRSDNFSYAAAMLGVATSEIINGVCDYVVSSKLFGNRHMIVRKDLRKWVCVRRSRLIA